MKKIDVLEMRSVDAGEISYTKSTGTLLIDIYDFKAEFKKSTLGFFFLSSIQYDDRTKGQHVYFSPVEFCKKLIAWVYYGNEYSERPA